MASPITEADLADPVTQHMRRNCARFETTQTVSEALASLHANQPEGRIVYFYVVDSAGRLAGVVPTRRLLLSDSDRRIVDIMVQPVVSIPASASVLDACEFFTMHRLLAFPVVDEQQRLVGIVDVELYTNELSDLEHSQRNDDLFQLIGVKATEGRRASPWTSFRSRFPWLLCNVVGGILAALIAGLYKNELERVVELALFIPVVLALGEAVSVQSVSLALQLMQGRRPAAETMMRFVKHELATGVLLGAACGLLVGGMALAWIRSLLFSICLVSCITGAIAFAAVIGLVLPSLIRLIQPDPKLAAGPIALATADIATLLLYLNLARWLLP